jgi:hypothetical protein
MLKRRTSIVGVVVLYAAMLVLVIFAAFRAREEALNELATPGEQAKWDQWREDVQDGEVEASGGVARRTPESAEPPWLVLMRDHFAVCLAAAVLFSSLLFGVCVYFAFAIWRTQERPATP